MKSTLTIIAILVLLASCSRTRPAVSEPEQIVVEEPSPDEPMASVDSTPLALVETDTVTIPGTEVSFTMALIPGGTSIMGSPDDEAGRDGDEGPQRAVTVEPFWMGTHEVAYEAFAIFRYRDRDSDAATGPSFSADAVARPSPPYEDPAHGMGNQGFPAAGMTQWGALHYARWLSEKTGDFYHLPPKPSGNTPAGPAPPRPTRSATIPPG